MSPRDTGRALARQPSDEESPVNSSPTHLSRIYRWLDSTRRAQVQGHIAIPELDSVSLEPHSALGDSPLQPDVNSRNKRAFARGNSEVGLQNAILPSVMRVPVLTIPAKRDCSQRGTVDHIVPPQSGCNTYTVHSYPLIENQTSMVVPHSAQSGSTLKPTPPVPLNTPALGTGDITALHRYNRSAEIARRVQALATGTRTSPQDRQAGPSTVQQAGPKISKKRSFFRRRKPSAQIRPGLQGPTGTTSPKVADAVLDSSSPMPTARTSQLLPVPFPRQYETRPIQGCADPSRRLIELVDGESGCFPHDYCDSFKHNTQRPDQLGQPCAPSGTRSEVTHSTISDTPTFAKHGLLMDPMYSPSCNSDGIHDANSLPSAPHRDLLADESSCGIPNIPIKACSGSTASVAMSQSCSENVRHSHSKRCHRRAVLSNGSVIIQANCTKLDLYTPSTDASQAELYCLSHHEKVPSSTCSVQEPYRSNTSVHASLPSSEGSSYSTSELHGKQSTSCTDTVSEARARAITPIPDGCPNSQHDCLLHRNTPRKKVPLDISTANADVFAYQPWKRLVDVCCSIPGKKGARSLPLSPSKSPTDAIDELMMALEKHKRRNPDPEARDLGTVPASWSVSGGLPRSSSHDVVEHDRGVYKTEGLRKKMKDRRKNTHESALTRPLTSNNSSQKRPPSRDLHDQAVFLKSSLNERIESCMPMGSFLGAVNVQFPDALVLKRRWLSIDNDGFLVFFESSEKAEDYNLETSSTRLDVAAGTDHRGCFTERFSISCFSAPYISDPDQQPLPHSVTFNQRHHGSCLHIACESKLVAQLTLRALRAYHRAWANL